ncbi:MULTISPECIES: hypothetical protein [Mumia]|uniref:hypothetical protein n=1 Tax=Mumia TaxID=1546255 RepID=UPI00141F4AE4|nr:hypothetical protein [Mumia sp. ZJ430]
MTLETEGLWVEWHVRRDREFDDIALWGGSVYAYDETAESEQRAVGHASIVVSLRGIFHERDALFEALDANSGDLSVIAEELGRHDDHELIRWSDGPGLGMVIVESVELEPAYRGRDLGVEIVRDALAVMSAATVVLYPAPIGSKSKRGEERLQAYWSRHGFEPLGNGVYIASNDDVLAAGDR